MLQGSSPGVSVELRGISKAYGDVVAVSSCDLKVDAGEFVALLGPSGSGKTTMLMMIAGFEDPTSGQVLLGENDVTNLPPRRRNVGVVFQQYALFPHMTVRENIAFGLKQRKVPKAEINDKVDAALDLVSLSGYGSRKISELSGGQQQRIAMARASVYEPPIMLMDEPLGALDRQLREQLQVELKALQRRLGTTFVFVTHDQAEALTMADRIAVIGHGVVQQFGTSAEIYETPKNLFVAGFVGQNNFLKGQIERKDDQTAVFFPEQGGRIPLAATNVEEGLLSSSGRVPAVLAIRPESLQFLQATDTSPAGEVVDVAYEGSTTSIVVRLDDGQTVISRRFRLDQSSTFQVGQRVELSVTPSEARAYRDSGDA